MVSFTAQIRDSIADASLVANAVLDSTWQALEDQYLAAPGSVTVYVRRVKLNLDREPGPSPERYATDPPWRPG